MENRPDYQPFPAPASALPYASPQMPGSAQPLTRRKLTWPAVFALYLLSPFIAEMLTGSTPPLRWNNPVGIILTTGLYGSGAILARELVRRRRLGWGNLALLGAAYGVLEEGMSFQSWFNPTWTPPADRLRFFEINWTFALAFTTIHVALSILSSVIVAEAFFPQLADRPWLSKKGFVGFTIWLGAVVAWLFFTYGFLLYHGKGYDHPPVSYLIAPLLFVLFLVLGLRRSHPRATTPDVIAHPAPRLWTLRGLSFTVALVFFVNLFFLRVLVPAPLVFTPIIIMAGIDLLGILLVRSFSKRSGWGMVHRLALTSGVLGFFIAISPFLEFKVHDSGITPVNLFVLGGLMWLARRTASFEAERSTRIAEGGTTGRSQLSEASVPRNIRAD